MTHGELNGFHYRFESGTDDGRTLLLLHGTGGDENDLIPLGHSLDPAASLLSPRGKVLEHGNPRFFRRFAEGVLDVDDLKARTHELVDFIGDAVEEHGLGPSRLVAVGNSNGANIAVSALLLRPGVLGAAVLFRPMVPFQPDDLPDLTGIPVFIGAARRDELIDPNDPERLATMLEKAGAEVELSWTPGGHALGPDDVRAAQAWLARRA